MSAFKTIEVYSRNEKCHDRYVANYKFDNFKEIMNVPRYRAHTHARTHTRTGYYRIVRLGKFQNNIPENVFFNHFETFIK